MCGIIGIISRDKDVTQRLIEGLKKLEYRGYDSAGLAVLDHENSIQRCRTQGKLSELIKKISLTPLKGMVGLGHTRWATHGHVSIENTHPLTDGSVAIVHNGIIENFNDLKQELIEKGYVFTTQTDTEAVLHLVSDHLKKTQNPRHAVSDALSRLKGSFAFAFIFKDHPGLMIVARQESPLVLGVSDHEVYVASDAIALSSWTQSVIYLKDGDLCELRLKDSGHPDIQIFDRKQQNVSRSTQTIAQDHYEMTKGGFPHFMLKEIFEQPHTIFETFYSLFSDQEQAFSNDLKKIKTNYEKIRIIACGTSYYAGLVGKYWLERYAKCPVEVDVASEFRYRHPVFTDKTLTIVISQSGETLDTLSALTLCSHHQEDTLAIINVDQSSIARQANFVLKTLAGPEIGVASTKAFTAQLTALMVLTLYIGHEKRLIEQSFVNQVSENIQDLSEKINLILKEKAVFEYLSSILATQKSVLYIGRGHNYPIALEGALKFKELSYIHAEAYPAGELKHGPMALIDEEKFIIVVAPYDHWFQKTASNIQEILARGAKVILITDDVGAQILKDQTKNFPCFYVYICPKTDEFVLPILYTVPIQLLAYYTATQKGTDVDQPRNLAKSVTVE